VTTVLLTGPRPRERRARSASTGVGPNPYASETVKRAAAVLLVALACLASAWLGAGCGGGNPEPEARLVTPGQVKERFKSETGKPLLRAAVPDEAWEQLGIGLNPAPPDLKRYGIFSIYVGKSGHLAALGSLLRDKATREPLERDLRGVYWELDSNSRTWVAYKRYARNVVLAWFGGSKTRAVDARWERLDRVLAGLAS
jgi:hypothetical protein